MLEAKKKLPLYQQIINDYCQKIILGYYKPNDKLPSLIQISNEKGTNPNTVQVAFHHLDKLGVTYTVKAKGRFVSENALKIISEIYFSKLQIAIINLSLCGIEKEIIIEHVNKVLS